MVLHPHGSAGATGLIFNHASPLLDAAHGGGKRRDLKSGGSQIPIENGPAAGMVPIRAGTTALNHLVNPGTDD